uniref:Ectonucleoside triphosphate diphosphohydrolase 8 n=1 Tax=Amazona collaria TaxID=241587 RepID=A0A8B9FUG3_9PSIT
GASTQITFQPGVTIEDKNTSVFFRLYGTNYSLYTHSYLCYGQTQALKRLLAALHQASPSTVQISHPCYPRGYQENITMAELYDSPCVRAPSTPSATQLLRVMGTGEPAACSAAVQQLFNLSCGANSTCGFNGVYQPPVRGQFFAFAGFYYTFHFLNLTSQQSLKDVNSTVQAFCKKDWAELVETFPQQKGYLHKYCSMAIYILTLLLDGYKFSEHTWSSIHFRRQVTNTDIGWTLGFMLNLTNMIPTEALGHVKGQQPSLWAGAVSCIVLAIVAGLVALSASRPEASCPPTRQGCAAKGGRGRRMRALDPSPLLRLCHLYEDVEEDKGVFSSPSTFKRKTPSIWLIKAD